MLQDTPTVARIGFRRGNAEAQPHSTKAAKKRLRRTGAHFTRKGLIKVDRRTKEGAFLHSYERMLIQHLGGAPSITQRVLTVHWNYDPKGYWRSAV
jgi:hypothetical protein